MELPENVTMKYLMIEVDGDLVLRVPVPAITGTDRHEMIQAAIDSNPTLRLVD